MVAIIPISGNFCCLVREQILECLALKNVESKTTF